MNTQNKKKDSVDHIRVYPERVGNGMTKVKVLKKKTVTETRICKRAEWDQLRGGGGLSGCNTRHYITAHLGQKCHKELNPDTIIHNEKVDLSYARTQKTVGNTGAKAAKHIKVHAPLCYAEHLD